MACSAAGAICTIAMLFEARGPAFLATQGEACLAVALHRLAHRQDVNLLPTP